MTRTRLKRLGLIAVLGALLVSGAAACTTQAEPDQVGLWYGKGSSDGNRFDHCVEPGSTQGSPVNDYIIWTPDNVRTWNIQPQGGDSDQALRLTAKPDLDPVTHAAQQSGLEVLVWAQATLKLNTWCGTDNKDPNSPLPNWWENLGRRYDANDEAGWRNMLLNTVVPAMEKAKNVLRSYTADELVQGSVWAEAEAAFGATFSAELTRLSGGKYFCGPSFSRTDPTGKPWTGEAPCPDVAISIKDVDYADPGIQEARNKKQTAAEEAAAAVISAQGEVDAANKRNELYGNPAWVALEKIRLIAEACAKSPNCRIIVGGDGSILIGDS